MGKNFVTTRVQNVKNCVTSFVDDPYKICTKSFTSWGTPDHDRILSGKIWKSNLSFRLSCLIEKKKFFATKKIINTKPIINFPFSTHGFYWLLHTFRAVIRTIGALSYIMPIPGLNMCICRRHLRKFVISGNAWIFLNCLGICRKCFIWQCSNSAKWHSISKKLLPPTRKNKLGYPNLT